MHFGHCLRVARRFPRASFPMTQVHPVDEAARSMRAFLVALGLPVDDDPELAGTPERVARAYRDELLDGYRRDPAACLAAALPSRETGLVVVTGIRYASVCPHHLLPSWGSGHLGYLPDGKVVGLGSLVDVLTALAHRLVLQETLGRQVAEALHTHLGARAAGVVLDAQHACLCARGERESAARVVTHSYAGTWASDPLGRAEFLQAVSHGTTPHSDGSRRL